VIDGVSFIGEDKPWNEDDFGHGTAVTSVVAKTAPNAEIYIARVLRYNPKENKCVVDKDAVAQAIVHAVNVWKVDVINMSFGWNADDHDEFDRAMGLAAGRYVDGKLRPVLMFAATSNYGLGPQNHILWPARSPHVISIDAAYGNGAEWEDNPKVNDMGGKLRFTALGVEVNCEYPLHRQPAGTPSGTMVRHTGTSFACATASGIAVFVLEFAQQPPCSWIPELYDRLVRRPDIMQKVFLVMSDSKNVEGFHFLYPWTLLRGYGDDRFGGDATPGTARWDAAYEIAKIMDKEFGSNLKALFFPEYEKRRPKPA
jgi:subtilisin family serine protease